MHGGHAPPRRNNVFQRGCTTTCCCSLLASLQYESILVRCRDARARCSSANAIARACCAPNSAAADGATADGATVCSSTTAGWPMLPMLLKLTTEAEGVMVGGGLAPRSIPRRRNGAEYSSCPGTSVGSRRAAALRRARVADVVPVTGMLAVVARGDGVLLLCSNVTVLDTLLDTLSSVKELRSLLVRVGRGILLIGSICTQHAAY